MLMLVCLPVVGDEYRVTLELSKPRLATVEAELSPTDEGELLLLRNAEDSGIEGTDELPLIELDPRANAEAASRWAGWSLP